MNSLSLTGGRVVTPAGVVVDDVVITGGRFERIGPGSPTDEIIDVTDLLVLPGFIDLHVHGGGGAAFDDGPDAIRVGMTTHRANGTTPAR